MTKVTQMAEISIIYYCGKCDHKLASDLYCVPCKKQYTIGDIK